MFGGLISVRLKAAERALKDGRLDDALRMASEPDIAGHARGGRLLSGLGRAFLERARDHYRAERFTEALLDLGRAERCGADEAEVAALRAQVTVVAREVARQEADRKRRLEQARRYIDGGSLAAGRQLLQSAVGDDGDLEQIRKEIENRARRAADLVAQAENLYRQQRLAAAAEHLQRALELDAHSEPAMQLEARICADAVESARAAFAVGNIRRAAAELAELGKLAQHDDARGEIADWLRGAEDAARCFAAGRYEETAQRLRRLAGLAPRCTWLQQALKELEQVAAGLAALRSGPLGDVPGAGVADTQPAVAETILLAPPQAPSAQRESMLPVAMLLLVDGGGSYLLHRGDRVSIGRAAAADPADIPLVSDLSARHAELLRVEDDYFLLSPHDAEVAGRRVRQQLLHDGDRVVLARRAKFTLNLPNRRTSSARLVLSDSTKMPHDVRCVVLFKQAAMIGRGPDCHVTCHSARVKLVLFERGGRLWVRPQRGGSELEIVPGSPVEMDGASFVVRPWTAPTSGPLQRV
ncbi:MAG TPA: hypothetical protein P5572_11430 [Phycisphaerae bacterium]|nr:hypothetical protein [Phycisphaerales bacterium]HRX85619.1 hypothetical protein [Phycisphaerae bacterium]